MSESDVRVVARCRTPQVRNDCATRNAEKCILDIRNWSKRKSPAKPGFNYLVTTKHYQLISNYPRLRVAALIGPSYQGAVRATSGLRLALGINAKQHVYLLVFYCMDFITGCCIVAAV